MELLEHHQRFLAFLLPRVESRDVAEEILQTAYLKYLQQSPKGQTGRVVPWFFRVLRNAVIDHYRERGRSSQRQEPLEDAFLGEPFKAEAEAAICGCLREILPTLQPGYAALVEAVDLQEQPLAEAAARAGITLNNATVRLHRARKALRAHLAQACGTCATHACLDCGCRRTPKPEIEV